LLLDERAAKAFLEMELERVIIVVIMRSGHAWRASRRSFIGLLNARNASQPASQQPASSPRS